MSDAGGYDTNGGGDDGGYDGQRPAPILPLFEHNIQNATFKTQHLKRKKLCWPIGPRLNT